MHKTNLRIRSGTGKVAWKMQSAARQYPEMACHYCPLSFHIQNQKKKKKETSDNYLTLTEKISVFLQPYVGAKSIDVLKYKIILNI